MQALAHRRPFIEHPRRSAIEPLAASHDGFLAAASDFVARLEWIGGGDASRRVIARQAAQLAPRFRDWQWTMTCHERFEERTLVPLVAERAGVDVSELADEHAHLHQLADRCLAGFEQLAAALAAGHDDELVLDRARLQLGEYVECLRHHLETEETRLFPALLRIAVDQDELTASCSSR